MIALGIDIDLTFDYLLDSEAACEVNHNEPGLPECSGHVTHFASVCVKSGLACDAWAAVMVPLVEEAKAIGAVCEYCDRPVAECWRVVPV